MKTYMLLLSPIKHYLINIQHIIMSFFTKLPVMFFSIDRTLKKHLRKLMEITSKLGVMLVIPALQVVTLPVMPLRASVYSILSEEITQSINW